VAGGPGVAVPTPAEKPVAPEKNPPGDIPDTQVFVEYVSAAGGYQLKAPEGWARQTDRADVTFTDKLDGLSVTITSQPTAPSVVGVTKNRAAALKMAAGAAQIKGVKDLKLPGGAAILLVYQSNSAPDPVTGKQVRLDNNEYLFYKQGKLATLRLWAPVGADNVDQWKLMSESFRWK
jgi:hypothetical protein